MFEQKYLSLRQIFESRKARAHIGHDLFSSSKLSEIDTHFCVFEDAFEEDAPLSLPIAVVPAGNDLESFFADIATYFADHAPITAYTHVLSEATYKELERNLGTRGGFRSDQHKLSTYLGLILGDALSDPRLTNQKSVSLGYSACRRTLAYCIARTALLHPQVTSTSVASRWLQLRELAGMEVSPNAATSLCWITDVINGQVATTPNQEIVDLLETLAQYFERGGSREKITKNLGSLYPNLLNRPSSQHDPYEKRIEAFNAIVATVQMNSRGSELDSMCVAFFCNLILPGSLAHSALIERLLPNMPFSMQWYGVFAGSSEEFSPTASAGGVGQKLLRDLIAPFDLSRRPSCDISFDEYEVLARLPLRSSMIKPTQAKAVLVSLYPGVEVYVRSAMEDDDAEDRHFYSTAHRQQNERLAQARHLLSQVDQLLRVEDSGQPAIRSRAKTTGKNKAS